MNEMTLNYVIRTWPVYRVSLWLVLTFESIFLYLWAEINRYSRFEFSTWAIHLLKFWQLKCFQIGEVSSSKFQKYACVWNKYRCYIQIFQKSFLFEEINIISPFHFIIIISFVIYHYYFTHLISFGIIMNK